MRENLKRIAQEVLKGEPPTKGGPVPQRPVDPRLPYGPELLTREGWNKLKKFLADRGVFGPEDERNVPDWLIETERDSEGTD